MPTHNLKFYADVLNSSGDAVVGRGPLYNIISASVTARVDEAGEGVVTLPATDTRAIELVENERWLRVYASIRGTATEVGEILCQDLGTAVQQGQFVQTVSGLDRMAELNRYSTLKKRKYDNVATADIIGTTAAGTGLLRSTGWTQGSISASVTPTTIEYNNQTVLQALIALAKQTGDHIREGSAKRTLDYGTFGGTPTARIANAGVMKRELSIGGGLIPAIISQISINEISNEIHNRIFPQGANGFTLKDAPTTVTDILVMADRGPTGASTTVAAGGAAATTVNVADTTGFTAEETIWIGDADDWTQDHEEAIIESVGVGTLTVYVELANAYALGADVIQTPQYYIEDGTSQAAYGVREYTPTFSWIGPGEAESDATLVTRAAYSLYAASLATMARYKDPYTTITIPQVLNFPLSVQPGDLVRTVYKGAADIFGAQTFYEIDEDLYVLSVTRTWSAEGLNNTALEVASIIRPTPNNLNLLIYNLDTFSYITPQR